MLFNDKPSYTFGEIVEATGIPRGEAKLHVVSMTLKKYAILLKDSKSKGLADSDVLSVNPKFKSKLIKVRVPLVTLKQKTKKENKEEGEG